MYESEDSLIRRRLMRSILTASFKSNACHIGSALSCLDILIDLYYHRMKPDDIFIFSKASGVSALYAILADKGIFPQYKVAYYLKYYPLASKEVKGVFCSTGSLGHGLPISVGAAYGKRDINVYCLISDAEVQEGTFWESLLFASHHKLTNLYIVADCNGFQACGRTKDIIKIDKALRLAQKLFPIEIVNTVKGCGLSFMENDNRWHYKNLTHELYEKAMKELE